MLSIFFQQLWNASALVVRTKPAFFINKGRLLFALMAFAGYPTGPNHVYALLIRCTFPLTGHQPSFLSFRGTEVVASQSTFLN